MNPKNKKPWWVIHINPQGTIISLLVMYCIIFPADILNIKEIMLVLALIVSLPAIVSRLKEGRSSFLFFYGLVYPGFFTLASITAGDSSIYGALSFGYVWIFLLLIPAIEYYDIDVRKPFIFATSIIAMMTIFILFADILGMISIYSNPLIRFFSAMNELQYGKGKLATFGYSIFFKASPLMLFSYGYMLKNKKWLYAAIFLLAFGGSGTRANLIVALIATAAILLLCSGTPTKKMIVLFLLIVVGMIILPSLIERLTALTVIKFDRSESIKLAAITSVFEHMDAEPYRYIFGSGVGSYFYSRGRNAYVDVVEVSFFDYFRQVGLVGFSLFMVFLIKPLKNLMRESRWLLVCYIGYLAIAFTNPLLVTSTSFIAYITILSRSFYDCDCRCPMI